MSFFDLFALFLITQTKAQNIPLYLLFRVELVALCKSCGLVCETLLTILANIVPLFLQFEIIQTQLIHSSKTLTHSDPKHAHKSAPEPDILLRPWTE